MRKGPVRGPLFMAMQGLTHSKMQFDPLQRGRSRVVNEPLAFHVQIFKHLCPPNASGRGTKDWYIGAGCHPHVKLVIEASHTAGGGQGDHSNGAKVVSR